MTEKVSLRRRLPWKWMGLAVVLVGGAVLGVSALFGWQERSEKRAALEEAARIYQTFRACVLGEGVPDRQLGRKVAEAEASGRLDGNRYRTCRAPAVAALEAIGRETQGLLLPSFIVRDTSLDGPDRFGVCADLAYAARIIADQAGRGEPDIDCDPHIDPR